MTVEEYHLLPGDPAWKVEYIDGEAVWEPRHNVVTLIVPVTVRAAQAPCLIRPVQEGDRAALEAGYAGAFADTIDLYGYSPEAMTRSAARDVGAAYQEDPAIRAASHVALAGEDLIGSALVARFETGPHLDVLFVRACWRRGGVARALVAAMVNALYAQGEMALSSFHHIGNQASAAWHRSAGFMEIPDLMIARLRWRAHQQDLSRDDQTAHASAGSQGRAGAPRCRGEGGGGSPHCIGASRLRGSASGYSLSSQSAAYVFAIRASDDNRELTPPVSVIAR